MGHSALIPVLISIAFASAMGQNTRQPSAAFHWLDSTKDATLFDRIKADFRDELRPDDPEKVKPYVAEEYKWISRVGVVDSSALVLIGERETRTSKYGDYFVAFNYDLKSGKKTSLNRGFMDWTFKKLIRFDSSPTPDVVFTYPSCTECEADYLLSSFRFDSSDGK